MGNPPCTCGVGGLFFVLVVGGVLLFRMLPRAVSLALSGLASGFGMGPGVSPDAVATNKSFFVVGVVFVFVLCEILWGGRGWVCGCWFRCISTSYLLTLRWLQFWPIDPVVFRAPVW